MRALRRPILVGRKKTELLQIRCRCNSTPSACLLVIIFGVSSARQHLFRTYQRKYNGLFSFTALAAGDCESRAWTNPKPPSMLTLHEKLHHRIFDLREKYETMRVNNSSRFYIYDSEFVDKAQQLGIDLGIAETLRTPTFAKIFHGLVNFALLSTTSFVLTPLVPNQPLSHLRKLAESTTVTSSAKKYAPPKSRLSFTHQVNKTS